MNDPILPSADPTDTASTQPQDGETVMLRWRQTARSVPLARRELRRTLERWGGEAVEGAASLVLSELLTNAVRHGRALGREVETRFIRTSEGLRIEVHDSSEKQPSMVLPVEGAEGGRGLHLVDALAAKWGVDERSGPGKLVWAELLVSGGPW
ncbi:MULTISPECIES: ATP-binding protein [unclassified Streptomyces]|uniref:ATP-binding protein n=1 Tax=unclassified Streptomyces TaxID=2593676 RepID=UPI0035E0DF8B